MSHQQPDSVLPENELRKDWAELLAEGRRLSRLLRRNQLRQENIKNPVQELPFQPDIFWEQAANGKYPIVAFRTVPCTYYLKGHCHPCGYSARSYPVNVDKKEIVAAIQKQLDWLLTNMEEVCFRHSDGKLNGYRLNGKPDQPVYMMQLAGMGSFFADREMPVYMRRMILERLAAYGQDHNLRFHVMLETRPEDLIAAEQSGELQELLPQLRELNVVVNLGFEAYDPFLRNVLFAKNLTLDVFEQALAVAQKYRLDPGVFVFAGGFILSPGEVLQHVRESLRYLEEKGGFVNLMVPNLQAGTLPHLLYQQNYYTLPEPFFLLDLVELLMDYSPKRRYPVTPFSWFLGGFVADPEPEMTIFHHPRKKTSPEVGMMIAECLRHLVESGSKSKFMGDIRSLRMRDDYKEYLESLQERETLSWADRYRCVLRGVRPYVPV